MFHTGIKCICRQKGQNNSEDREAFPGFSTMIFIGWLRAFSVSLASGEAYVNAKLFQP
jgi:membrane-bound acyltransferase YfiQ involved in biofilm formation